MCNTVDKMITKGNWESFLSLNGEKLLLVQRRHPLVLFLPIFLISIFGVIGVAAAFFMFTYLSSLPLFIATTLLIVSIAISVITQTVVRWYFHLYILTTRKILEVWYTPLFSHIVNDVLLDKVNCTEIDFYSKGFFHELIDMGDVVITFDRPTHEEEFVLRDIKACDRIGKFLTQRLLDNREKSAEETIWIRNRGISPVRGAL